MPASNWVPIVLIFGALLLVGRLQAQKRRVALTKVAQRLGLAFEARDWGSRSSGPQLESRHFANTYKQRFANSLSGERAGFYASFFDHVINARKRAYRHHRKLHAEHFPARVRAGSAGHPQKDWRARSSSTNRFPFGPGLFGKVSP